MLIFLSIWFAFWTVGGVTAVLFLLHPDSGPPVLIMVFWLIVWAAAELSVAYIWLWSAFGKELVTVGNGNLVLKKDILGYGRAKVFPVSQVSNLRASGLFGSFLQGWGWSGMAKFYGLSGGVIAFESGGKTHRFGIQLEEDEARQVAAELANHLR